MVSVQIPFTQVKDEYVKVEVECGTISAETEMANVKFIEKSILSAEY
jgi:hypothetical protein